MLDEAEANLMYYNMGVFSPVDIIMKKDSDLTDRASAMERLKLIKTERESLAPPIDDPSSNHLLILHKQQQQCARPGVKREYQP